MRGFSLRSSAINYLMPMSQASRQREMKRMSQHRAIAKTLFEAAKKEGVDAPVATAFTATDADGAADASGEASAAAAAAGAEQDAVRGAGGDAAGEEAAAAAGGAVPGAATGAEGADAAVLSWKGPKLVAERCGVHPLRLSVWRSLQYVPSLMYRLEVRAALFSTCSCRSDMISTCSCRSAMFSTAFVQICHVQRSALRHEQHPRFQPLSKFCAAGLVMTCFHLYLQSFFGIGGSGLT